MADMFALHLLVFPYYISPLPPHGAPTAPSGWAAMDWHAASPKRYAQASGIPTRRFQRFKMKRSNLGRQGWWQGRQVSPVARMKGCFW